MQHLMRQDIRSLILTSGTLSSFKSISTEMGIEFSVQHRNPHIVKNFQIFAKIVSRGIDHEVLDCRFNNR